MAAGSSSIFKHNTTTDDFRFLFQSSRITTRRRGIGGFIVKILRGSFGMFFFFLSAYSFSSLNTIVVSRSII